MTSTIDNPRARNYGAVLLRLSLGVMWIAHALLKLLVFTLAGTADFFASVGLPGFMAYPVFAAELIGGMALVLGVHARQVALALVPIMAAAAWVHFPNGWVHTSPGGGWEYPVFLIVVSIAYWLTAENPSRSAAATAPLRSAPAPGPQPTGPEPRHQVDHLHPSGSGAPGGCSPALRR